MGAGVAQNAVTAEPTPTNHQLFVIVPMPIKTNAHPSKIAKDITIAIIPFAEAKNLLISDHIVF